MRILLCLLCFGAVWQSQGAEVQTFTSADGSKTLQATIEGYQPASGTGTLRVNGRRMNVPVSAFISEDKAKFEGWYEATEIGRQLRLNFEDAKNEGSERKLSNATITNFESGYNISVRNNASTAFEGVKLQYRIFYYQDKDKGGKVANQQDGELDLGTIAPRETKELSTEKVSLTRQRPKQ